jgi:hypothetical protein
VASSSSGRGRRPRQRRPRRPRPWPAARLRSPGRTGPWWTSGCAPRSRRRPHRRRADLHEPVEDGGGDLVVDPLAAKRRFELPPRAWPDGQLAQADRPRHRQRIGVGRAVGGGPGVGPSAPTSGTRRRRALARAGVRWAAVRSAAMRSAITERFPVRVIRSRPAAGRRRPRPRARRRGDRRPASP